MVAPGSGVPVASRAAGATDRAACDDREVEPPGARDIPALPDGLLGAIIAQATGALGAARCCLWLAEPEADLLRPAAWSGFADEDARELRAVALPLPAVCGDRTPLPVLCSPLVVPIGPAAEPHGVLALDGGDTPRRWTAEDRRLAGALAGQAAITIANARHHAAERQRAERAELLRELARELTAELDLDRRLAVLQEQIRRITGATDCWVALRDEAAGRITAFTSARGYLHVDESAWIASELGIESRTMVWSLFNERRAILTDDLAGECARRGLRAPEPEADRPGRAWFGLPLLVGERAIGALAIWRWDGPIPPGTVALLTALAGQIASALENARLYAEAERQRREEMAFNAIAQDLAGTLDGMAVLSCIVAHAQALLAVPAATVALFDPAAGVLRYAAHAGPAARPAAADTRPGEGVVGRVWETGRPLTVEDYPHDRHFGHTVALDEATRAAGLVSFLGVPIALGEERLGVLLVGTVERRRFTRRDEALLCRLAAQAALAVRNARLYAAEGARAARAEALREVGRAVSAELDLDRLLATAWHHISRIVAVADCWLAVWDPDARALQYRFYVLDGVRRPDAEGGALPGEGLAGALTAGRATIRTADYVAECRRRGLRPTGPGASDMTNPWLGVPLLSGGHLIGALAVWRPGTPFSADEAATLETLSGQIASALANAGMYEETERQRREEAAFNGIARDLAGTLDGDALLQRIAEHTRALLGARLSAVLLHDPARDLLRVAAGSGREPGAGEVWLVPGDGLADWVWQQGEPLRTDDYLADTRFAHTADLDRRATARGAAALGVPIALGAERLGVLIVTDADPRHFSARDEALLTRLAAQAALAVRNSRLYADIRARAARLEVLNEIGRELSAELDFDRFLTLAWRRITRLINVEACCLALWDEADGALDYCLYVDEGVRRPELEVRHGPEAGLSWAIVHECAPIFVPDYGTECRRRGVATVGEKRDRPAIPWIGLPLLAGGRAIGTLAVWRTGQPFAAEELAPLETLAAQIASALANARLYGEAERRRREEAAFGAIAQDLAAALGGDTVLRRIAEHTRALFDSRLSTVLLHDPARDLLRVAAGGGERPPGAGEAILGPDEGLAGWVWQHGRPLITDDYPADTRFKHTDALDRSVAAYGSAALGVPIALGEERLGVLIVTDAAPRRFAARDEALLTRLAAQAALAVRNARLYAAARERADRLEVLNETIRELSAEIDFDRFLDLIWRQLGRITNLDGCWVGLWREEAEELQICLYIDRGRRHREWEKAVTTASGEGLAPAIVRERDPLRVADYGAECRRRGLRPAGTSPDRPAMPWLGIPLVIGGRTVGAMAAWRWEGPFGDEEVATLATVAGQIAATLENARLYREARTLAATDPLTGLLNHRRAQECLDQELARAARRGSSLAVVMLDLNNFKLFNDTYGHPAGDEILRATAAALRAEARAADVVGRYGGDEFLLVLPDTTADGALALIARVQERLRRVWVGAGATGGGDEPTIPVQVSAGIALYPTDGAQRHELIALADSALYASKRGGGRPVAVAPRPDLASGGPAVGTHAGFDVVEGLVRATDAKDHYTVAHSQVVADAAVTIAEALGLPERERTILRTAGLLHDVGKISIPDRILRKPGQLDAEEWAIMRQHVEFSALIIRGVPGLAGILEPVMHHHERWDGRGYPRGLAGEDVPLLGRIMIVADAYSAMVLDRPYRRGLTTGEALAQLRAGAGTQFDPALVAALCAALERQGAALAASS